MKGDEADGGLGGEGLRGRAWVYVDGWFAARELSKASLCMIEAAILPERLGSRYLRKIVASAGRLRSRRRLLHVLYLFQRSTSSPPSYSSLQTIDGCLLVCLGIYTAYID